MLKKEYWWKEIVDIVTSDGNCSFAVDMRTRKPCKCDGSRCRNCLFNHGRCDYLRNKWANSEHIEPIKLTLAEKIILENFDSNFKWIARDINDKLFCYDGEPYKSYKAWEGNGCHYFRLPFDKLFDFIKFEDENAYNIEDILNNCEVVEDVD